MVFQGENSLSETLLKRINDSGQVYMIPAKLRDMYVIRFAVCSRYTELSDIQASCQEISPFQQCGKRVEDADPKLFCAIKIHSLLLFLMQKKPTFCLFYSNMIFLGFQPI